MARVRASRQQEQPTHFRLRHTVSAPFESGTPTELGQPVLTVLLAEGPHACARAYMVGR